MNQNSSVDESGSSLRREFKGIPVLLLLLIVAMAARCEFAGRPPQALQAASKAQLSTVYVNKEYGFRLDLPQDWSGFSVIQEDWSGASRARGVQDQSGPLIRIRHPKYTENEPYEDIPIMVFTHKQWKTVEKQSLVVSAAPFPPAEIGHNARFVFATPPRFYYDFAKGYEEVLNILGKQFRAFAPAQHPRKTSSSHRQAVVGAMRG